MPTHLFAFVKCKMSVKKGLNKIRFLGVMCFSAPRGYSSRKIAFFGGGDDLRRGKIANYTGVSKAADLSVIIDFI